MFLKPSDAIEQISKAIDDAYIRVGPHFQILSWPQTWPNTSCGFGGICGQAFTEAQTVIVSGQTETVLVYHRGKFAYEVPNQTDEFLAACGQRTLPGAKDWPTAKIKLGYKDQSQ